jgi:DNA helicase IV
MQVSVDPVELGREQKYFDEAWDEREQTTANIKSAPHAAAGPRAGVSAMQKAIRKELEQRPSADEEVAFGRFDTEDGPLYIGKHAILNDDRDVLVANWQMPAAAPFYEATPQNPRGVALIRKYTNERNTIITFEDTLLADLASRVEQLTADQKRGVDDVLLRDLEASRDGEMRDIVQTIHASQYDLIRKPLERLLVIQGGPGTGKTAVALHRASWLLYNYRDSLAPEDVLVIGPSKTFSRYIQKVLPGLGNQGVIQRELTSLGPIAGTGREEALEVARLKGDPRMAEVIERALWQRVRVPENLVDRLTFGGGAEAVGIPIVDIEARLDTLRRSGTYNAGRQAMRIWLNEQASALARGRGTTRAPDASAIDAALERIWPQLTSAQFLQELLGSRLRITNALGDEFTAGDIDRLYRQAASKLSDEQWSDADVALLDEADLLINGRGTTFNHVVVDEAQDLSPMQLRSVRRRSARGSYTIVGDVAQSTGPWARDSWEDVIDVLQLEHDGHIEELRYGYRVPAQVMELADLLLPQIAPKLAPATIIRRGPTEPDFILSDDPLDAADDAVSAASRYAGQGLFTGVICPADSHADVVQRLRARDIKFQDAADGQLSNAINVMTAHQSKGLEFDAIVVLEPAAIADGSQADLREVYIALTRTTKHLTIVHSEPFEPLRITDGHPTHGISTANETPAVSEARSAARRTHDTEPASTRPSPAPSGPTKLQAAIVRTATLELAAQIRETVLPAAWPTVLASIAKELGVGDQDLTHAMEHQSTET